MDQLVTIVYIGLCAAGLPWWVAQQHLGGRSILLILFSCFYGMYALITGMAIPMDTITLATGLIGLWIAASLIWTDTRQSVLESFNWLSYLILFMASRTVPVALVAAVVFPTAAIFAAMMVYRTLFRPEMSLEDKMFGMGNTNHNGAYMLVYFFIGLWLTVNLSPWYLPFVALIAAAMVITKCKSALVGTIIGTIVIMCFYGLWPVALILAAAALARAYFSRRSVTFTSVLRTSAYCRIYYSLAAASLIIRKPFTGWGLNSYRKELPETDNHIINSRFIREKSDKLKIGIKPSRTHRVHNDHLELMVELGVTGYVLFIYLFSSISYDTITLGLFIAFAVCACFFFPLREVHTGAPFWVMMGTAAAGSPAAFALPVPVILVASSILLAIMIRTARVCLGQWYSEMAKSRPGIDEKTKLQYIDTALANDPHNGGYLSDAAAYYSKINPVRSFAYAARCLFEYDGTRVLHGVYDLFTRTLIAAKETNLMHWAEDNALRLEPGFKLAVTIKEYLAWREQEEAKGQWSEAKGKDNKNDSKIITMKNHIIRGARR